ncbi:tetratricopeptide repeat protein 37-like [Pollicipes pollicipes]|uniref:tetratricopeptide repeat protein 37-like n=1 Tax=Pollicipes pollicipes TaxID=41117 RepID=UPI00188531F7|nr:tetratricopeptide repeat protein 37-like [Pollicipes pollicipes]
MDKHSKSLLKSAKEAIKGKDHAAALELCKEVLSTDKKNYTALVFSGACYQELGDAEKTVEMFERAIEISSELPLAWQGLGSFYEKAGSSKHQDSLIKVYSKLLSILSNDEGKAAELCSKLSWLLVHANRLGECIQTLCRWSICSKESFDPSKITTVLKDKKVSDEQAEEILNILNKVISEENTARNKEFLSHQAILLQQLSRWPQLLAVAQLMWRTFPDSVVAAEWILRVYVESAETVTQLDTVLAFMDTNEPDNIWSQISRGKLLFLKADWAGTLQQLEPGALGTAGDIAAVHLMRGRAQLAVHGYAGAERSLQAALSRAEPAGTAERLRALGLTLWSVGSREQAAARFLEAAKQDPHHPEPFFYLGQYYEQVGGDASRALRCYQKACRLCPGEPRASAALSDLYRQRGEHELNVALLTAVTESRPDAVASRWAWFRLGLHHLQASEPQRAVSCLQTVVRAEPADAVAWECLGDAYRLRGAYTSAVQAFGRAAALDQSAVYARLQVAEIRQRLGLLQEAEDGYLDTLRARPGYVPALKGLGETHLRRAHELLRRQLPGSAHDSCQLAADALAAAVLDQAGMSCLWKELADVLYLTATLPPRYRRLDVPHQLLPAADERTAETGTLAAAQLADVAIRCYSQAVAIEDRGSLWHDLAQTYRLRAAMCDASEAEAAERAAQRALQCAHQATRLLPTDPSVWNTLGVIACGRHVHDRRLAQHAFIKSLRLMETAMVWTNLACLYMLSDQLMLAHEALTKAQSVEPAYCGAWTGQALIAERLDPDQAMDLFRHAVSLAPHPLAALGYGRWVSRELRDPAAWNTARYRFNIERMQAVTVASDALACYTDAAPDDAAGWNLAGLLAERQGRRRGALDACQRALALLEGATDVEPAAVDAVRVNCARLLTATGRCPEAIAEYGRLSEASFHSQCGLALALHRAERYEQAYEAYEGALHWLTPDDANRSHTLVAVATMLYQFGDAENARTQLLKSFQLEPASERGLLALTALRALQAAVHRHPQQSRLWRLLCAGLLQLRPELTAAAVTTAAAAQRLDASADQDADEVTDLVCQSQLRAGEGAAALRAAQRAVLRRPDSAAAWCDLVCSVSSDALRRNHRNQLNSPTTARDRVTSPYVPRFQRITWA